MIRWQGTWFADNEAHLPDWCKKKGLHKRDGHLTYQYQKYAHAQRWVKNNHVALDIGAHNGMWSRVMAMDFEEVLAFEPVPEFRECWNKNLAGFDNAVLFHYALGNENKTVAMKRERKISNGDTRVDPTRDGMTAMTTLDSFGFEDIGFVKIDCEGYERFIIEGAEETLKRCRPCVIVEQKKGKGEPFGLRDTEAVDLLLSYGAHLHTMLAGDFILSFDGF